MNVLEAVAAGVTATLFVDLWQRLLLILYGLPATNWALVGRWFVGALGGRLFRQAVAREPEVPQERAIGWVFHYAVGILYGFLYLLVIRRLLAIEPSLANGLLFGIASVAVPWFFFMPAMGAGLLARRTARPRVACLQALASHTVFGIGLAAGSFLL